MAEVKLDAEKILKDSVSTLLAFDNHRIKGWQTKTDESQSTKGAVVSLKHDPATGEADRKLRKDIGKLIYMRIGEYLNEGELAGIRIGNIPTEWIIRASKYIVNMEAKEDSQSYLRNYQERIKQGDNWLRSRERALGRCSPTYLMGVQCKEDYDHICFYYRGDNHGDVFCACLEKPFRVFFTTPDPIIEELTQAHIIDEGQVTEEGGIKIVSVFAPTEEQALKVARRLVG